MQYKDISNASPALLNIAETLTPLPLWQRSEERRKAERLPRRDATDRDTNLLLFQDASFPPEKERPLVAERALR